MGQEDMASAAILGNIRRIHAVIVGVIVDWLDTQSQIEEHPLLEEWVEGGTASGLLESQRRRYPEQRFGSILLMTGAATGGGGGGSRSPRFTIAVFCLAQSLAQVGAMTFAALLPAFFVEWSLNHAEAGWLSGIIFGAYAAAVPILLPMTDRIEARNVYVAAISATMLSHLGMAFLADGFWTGLIFRALNGIGWAGTYMVGLKALADQVEGPGQSRAVAAHAASIGISSSFSFVIAGIVTTHFGWQAAFMVGAGGAFGAMLVALTLFPRSPSRGRPARRCGPWISGR